jgi:hypothetical protein
MGVRGGKIVKKRHLLEIDVRRIASAPLPAKALRASQ